jgi:hypothetical protein
LKRLALGSKRSGIRLLIQSTSMLAMLNRKLVPTTRFLRSLGCAPNADFGLRKKFGEFYSVLKEYYGHVFFLAPD